MGIGRNSSDRKGRELCDLSAETKSTNSKSRKNRRHRQRNVLPVQRLFQTCKQVFASTGPGVVPSPQHIEMLHSILAGIKPEDVGLKPDMPYFMNNSARKMPKITYLHIYECENFSMGIFCLPPGGVIPLHNHPEMTVFSKLLFGTMHIKSYDWVVDLPSEMPTILKSSEKLIMKKERLIEMCSKNNLLMFPTMPVQTQEKRLAKVKVDADFTAPCDPSILYPTDGGNMHCFTAVTACAVLDVLGPPYNDPDGRHCSYYHNFPFSNFSDGISMPEEERTGYEWLQEREKPEKFQVAGKMYSGPKIVEN